MSGNIKLQAKTLTSYRRKVLQAYNSRPEGETDAQFCRHFRIKVEVLRIWQELAGQELAKELETLAKKGRDRVPSAKTGTPHGYAEKDFRQECAEVIELTCGGRLDDTMQARRLNTRCELARYRLLQKIASFSSSDKNYRRFTRIEGML